MICTLISCDNQHNNTSPETQIVEPVEETVELTTENFYDYFDVSVEYYNYSPKSYSGGYILGVYTSPYYSATVSQRVIITPKSNVISCNNVKFKFCGCSIDWSYSNDNSAWDDWYWEASLPTNGRYDTYKTLYYYDLYTPATCPVPKSTLTFNLQSYVQGTVTILK